MIDVRYPRRIDASGNTVEEYHPLSMSIDLNIKPLSTATISLPRRENIPARSYVELFTPFGSAGFFRARSPEDAYGEDITSVELEHAITEVGDYLVKAKYDEMMAANTAMQTVFSHYAGGRWQLGSVAALGTDQIALSVNYDRVLDAMLSILEQKPNCYLAFNFSTTPWTVSVATKDVTVSAEGRLSRNIDSAKVIYDDTELCTRAYYEHETTTDSTSGMNLDGVPTFDVNAYNSAGSYVRYNSKLYLLPNGHESGETWANTTSVVQNNIPSSEWTYLDADTLATYGLVERRVPTGSDLTAAEALKVAQEYLRTHKEPKISVRVQGEELSSTTGEPLDAFTIGKLLRLALVDYNVTVERNITGVSWSDVIGEPESMEVLLGDEEDTAIKFLHDIDTKGGSGGGGGGKKKQEEQWKEYFTEYERDDYHFNLVAKHVNQANEILQQAGLYIDANGTLNYADDNERQIGGRLQVQADKVAMVVGTKNGKNYIKAAEISVSINEDKTGNANIMADHIYIGPISGADSDYTGKTLDGTVTAITSDFTTVNTLLAKKIEADDITATLIQSRFSSSTFTIGGGISCGSITSTGTIDANGAISASDLVLRGTATSLKNAYRSVRKTTSGGNVTLYFKDFSGTEDSVTFSKAATLQAEYGGSNSGTVATYTVTGNPADNFPSGNVATGSFTIHISSAAAYVTDPNGTIRARVANSYTDTAYKNGWNDCIDDATRVSVYTRSAGTYGGSNYSHYVFVSGRFENIGDGWYKTQSATAYSLPAKK